MRSIYVTTPIYYVNDKPHIGHAYTSIAADALCRWHRRCGDDVWMLTGTDEHGQKVLRSAALRGISPQAHCDELSEHFRALLRLVGVQNDDFIRTTEPRHTRVVQAVLQHLYDRGDIYAADYEGWYSTAAERFWTEKDLIDGKCPDTGQAVEWVTEKNWFFKMGAYADQLRAWIDENPGFLAPASRKSEVVGALRKEIGDLCISRPKERMSWGIELPFDPDYVTYVWFDALINYISFVGYTPDPSLPDFESVWTGRPVHIIGKDIMVPAHGIYWLAMLRALGFSDEKMPQLLVHGWWNRSGEKMSKSLGNIVDPSELVDTFGVDALRYYLVRDIHTGKDSNFDVERLVMLFNTELANELGNLCNRALNMSVRFTESVISPGGPLTADDTALQQSLIDSTAAYRKAMDNHEVSMGLEALNRHVVHCNQYAERMKPWELNKNPENKERLATVLHHLAESVAHCAVLLSPVLPDAAAKLADQLKLPKLTDHKLDDLKWGLVHSGHEIEKPSPVFPRIEVKAAE